MSRRRTYAPLKVLLNGKHVGVLNKASGGDVSFKYDQKWLDWEHAMPVSLSLPLQTTPHRGASVSAYFDNLLPDSEVILKGIAERVGARGIDAFSLLSEIGRDCAGALQFVPQDYDHQPGEGGNYETLTEKQVFDILVDLKRVPLGIRQEGGFRISVAGAQEKAAFLFKDGNWCRPLGTTPTTHIFKPQIGKLEFSTGTIDLSQSVENEYYCLKLLRAFGIDVANAWMENFKTKKVLVVERFDRRVRDNGSILRLPQEDMCQALGVPPTLKYQNAGGPRLVDILQLLSRSDTPHKDQQAVFKCQILFWLMGATDGHAKNFSIFLRPQNQFNLTPIYDVISAQPAFDQRQIPHKDYRLALSVGRKPHYKIQDIHGRHFVESAIAAGLGEAFAREAIVSIQDWFSLAFDAVGGDLPEDFPMNIHDSIKTSARARLPSLQSAFA
ncbi:MAG: type II toxin-antitoxin system HipA family toxin [Robiginitomaculum sp.]|nr:type II toxin-antitoxin system HipA family toxin [Robiginitomaculum sp.]